MASATLIDIHHDGTTVFVSVRVAESGNQGNKEYTATMLLSDLQVLPNNAAKKAALIAAVKAVRDSTIPGVTDLSAIANGAITI